MCRPGGTDSRTRTASSPGTVFSIGTIASAPAGIGAPVAMRNASPRPTVPSGRWPISARPTTRRSTPPEPASATSLERTAKPSIAEEEDGGRSPSGNMSSASGHPKVSCSGSAIGESGWVRCRTRSRACATERSPSAPGCSVSGGAECAMGAVYLDESFALDEVGQELPELLAHVLAPLCELHGRLEVIELVSDVEAPSLEHVGVHRLLPREDVDRVGELELSSDAGVDLVERVEDLRGQHVASDHREVRGRLVGLRLLHD